jgi:glucose dehydrogenase
LITIYLGLYLVNVGFIFSYILFGIGLDKAGNLFVIFSASFLACALLLIFLAVLNVLGFTTTIESKDLNNIIFLIFVVGIVSILGMGTILFDESDRLGAMVLAIFIVAIAFAGFFAGVILADKPAAEKEVTEKPITEKTAAERTVTVTLVEGTKTLQKEEITWLDTFIILLGISLIIAAFIAYSYALWTDF